MEGQADFTFHDTSKRIVEGFIRKGESAPLDFDLERYLGVAGGGMIEGREAEELKEVMATLMLNKPKGFGFERSKEFEKAGLRVLGKKEYALALVSCFALLTKRQFRSLETQLQRLGVREEPAIQNALRRIIIWDHPPKMKRKKRKAWRW